MVTSNHSLYWLALLDRYVDLLPKANTPVHDEFTSLVWINKLWLEMLEEL
jgi:hypothetical protein